MNDVSTFWKVGKRTFANGWLQVENYRGRMCVRKDINNVNLKIMFAWVL